MKTTDSALYRSPILPDRIRHIDGGFAFIPHRFLRDGFFASLSQHELCLYLLWVLAADRQGISFYGPDALCSLLAIDLDLLLEARKGLIDKDLIAVDGTRVQVLALPEHPHRLEPTGPLITQDDFERHDPATIRTLICSSLAQCDTQREASQRPVQQRPFQPQSPKER